MGKQTWQERGYKDTRERPDRNQRRFFMFERTPESEQAMQQARAAIAAERNVPADKISNMEVMRVALGRMGK